MAVLQQFHGGVSKVPWLHYKSFMMVLQLLCGSVTSPRVLQQFHVGVTCYMAVLQQDCYNSYGGVTTAPWWCYNSWMAVLQQFHDVITTTLCECYISCMAVLQQFHDGVTTAP